VMRLQRRGRVTKRCRRLEDSPAEPASASHCRAVRMARSVELTIARSHLRDESGTMRSCFVASARRCWGRSVGAVRNFQIQSCGVKFRAPQKVLRLVPNHGAALLYAYHKRQATSRGWPPSTCQKWKIVEQRPAPRYSPFSLPFSPKKKKKKKKNKKQESCCTFRSFGHQ
jgi:hypothetical protein